MATQATAATSSIEAIIIRLKIGAEEEISLAITSEIKGVEKDMSMRRNWFKHWRSSARIGTFSPPLRSPTNLIVGNDTKSTHMVVSSIIQSMPIAAGRLQLEREG